MVCNIWKVLHMERDGMSIPLNSRCCLVTTKNTGTIFLSPAWMAWHSFFFQFVYAFTLLELWHWFFPWNINMIQIVKLFRILLASFITSSLTFLSTPFVSKKNETRERSRSILNLIRDYTKNSTATLVQCAVTKILELAMIWNRGGLRRETCTQSSTLHHRLFSEEHNRTF